MSWAQRSAAGTAMILAVVLIRALTLQRLPKRTFVALWGMTLARLLLPWTLPSPLSVYAWGSRLFQATEKSAGTAGLARVISEKRMLPAFPAAEQSGAAVSPDWQTIVWLVGALVCGACFAAVYWACRRTFRESLPVARDEARRWLQCHPLRRRLEIRRSDRVSTPLTYGVLRPVILLPKAVDWEDRDTMRYVLTHEYVHIRRFDALLKVVMTVAACVHWFNPAVWGMYVLLNRDIELSCDEAVLRLFGERSKADYAMALLHLEEKRGCTAPLCSGFSINAIEERIKAIMKCKKHSVAALAAAVGLVFGVTAAFATSANGEAGKTSGEALDGAANAQAAFSDMTFLSMPSSGENGKNLYSEDGGETWKQLNGVEYGAVYPVSDVIWWTAEEYAAWLENEKEELQAIIGERGWTPSTGWFTWTQEKVDETIKAYEETLKEIERGVKVSRVVYDEEGRIDVQLIQSYDPQNIASAASEDTAVYTQRWDDGWSDAYARFGLTYREAEDALYFNGCRVRYFLDGAEVENGTAVVREWMDEDGVVDVHTVRQPVANADGSVDPVGRLIGIEAYDPREFDGEDCVVPKQEQEALARAEGDNASQEKGATLAEHFSRYKAFGITYVEEPAAGGQGNVYWNGLLVSSFADLTPAGGGFSFTSARQGGLRIQTVYDGERLAGVKTT